MSSSSTDRPGERYVVPLDRAAGADPGLVGAKSARLSRALAAGFPVPPGFVVTTEAFRAFLAPVVAEVARLLAAVSAPAAAPPALAAAARNLAALVERTPIPEPVAAEVLAAYRALGAPAVAVRSSAPSEDGAARSLAGLFESFLDVRGETDLLRRVRDCFASAFSVRALAAGDPAAGGARMAVLVQRMVPAEHAGILFTCDPRGVSAAMLVELARGSGDAVAQGAVTPARFAVDPRSGAARALAGGAAAPDIPAALFRDLAALGERAERLFGGPQDIEWAAAPGGALALLQSRPVTGIAARGAPGERWTAANSQEALEDPVTPLTYTFLYPAIDRGRQKVFDVLEVEAPPGEYMKTFEGRILFNVEYFRTFLERVPGIPTELFDYLIFGEEIGEGATIRFRMPPLDGRTFRIAAVIARSWLGAKGRMDRFVARFDRRMAELAGAELARLDDAALRAHLDEVAAELEEAFNLHVLGTAMAGWHYLALSKFLQHQGLQSVGGENVVDELVAGAPGMETARSSAAIFAVADAARTDEVRRLLAEEEPARALARLSDVPGGAEVRRALDAFLAEFGHRAEKEAELAAPRWREDPSFILRMVARIVGGPGAEPRLRRPAEAEAELAAKKRDMLRRLEAAISARHGFLGAGWRLVALRVLVRWAERYAPYRENLRFHALRAYERVRLIFLEVGRRLAARGALAKRDDVFFLEAEEALGALREGEAIAPDRAAALRERARERRAEYERWKAKEAAAAPAARAGEPAPGEAARAPDGRRYLQGIPVSGGVVEGRVRRADRLEDALGIGPDEILLARAASPAWTPVFFLAKGVLLDIGGMLSHCAVVAREYGIPCVVGAKHATALLADGDRVTLDANTGRVYLPEACAPAPLPR